MPYTFMLVLLTIAIAGCEVIEKTPTEPAFTKKRSLMLVPGTVWCGPGNHAASYYDLGDHRNTDECCRAHDTCPHKIEAFTTKYGYFNFSPFTLLHCDCDYEFGMCLARDNNAVSTVVGRLYFRTTKYSCFHLEETTMKVCVWRVLGKCLWEREETKQAWRAKIHPLPPWDTFRSIPS